MNTFQKEQEQTVTLVSFSGLHLFLLKSYRIFQKQLILGHEIQKDRFYRNKHLLATTRFWFGFLHFQSKEIEITYLVATLRSNYFDILFAVFGELLQNDLCEQKNLLFIFFLWHFF